METAAQLGKQLIRGDARRASEAEMGGDRSARSVHDHCSRGQGLLLGIPLGGVTFPPCS